MDTPLKPGDMKTHEIRIILRATVTAPENETRTLLSIIDESLAADAYSRHDWRLRVDNTRLVGIELLDPPPR